MSWVKGHEGYNIIVTARARCVQCAHGASCSRLPMAPHQTSLKYQAQNHNESECRCRPIQKCQGKTTKIATAPQTSMSVHAGPGFRITKRHPLVVHSISRQFAIHSFCGVLTATGMGWRWKVLLHLLQLKVLSSMPEPQGGEAVMSRMYCNLQWNAI